MSPDDPRHGTYAGAIAHWKDQEHACEACCRVARRESKRHRVLREQGRPSMVRLGDAAWQTIVETPRVHLVSQTGMRHERLRRYELAGPSARVHRSTRDRILAARPRPWTPIGIQRRLQALAALGWSLTAISTRSGLHRDSLARLRRRDTPKHVKTPFAERVLAAYDDLTAEPAPVDMSAITTRARAQRNGWHPPLAWDDIDDPNEDPAATSDSADEVIDEVVVERVLGGRNVECSRAEREEIVRRWPETGKSFSELERITGWRTDRYKTKKEAA